MFFQAMKFMAYGQSLTLVKHLHGTSSLDGFGYFQAGALAYALGMEDLEFLPLPPSYAVLIVVYLLGIKHTYSQFRSGLQAQ